MRRRLSSLPFAAGSRGPAALAAKGDPQKKFTKAGQARAQQPSLRLADFPPGWQAVAERRTTSESSPRCSYYNPDQSDLVEIGNYDSPDFSQAGRLVRLLSTGVFKTAAMAKTGYARVAVRHLPDCFGELFKKGITEPSDDDDLLRRPARVPEATATARTRTGSSPR